MRVFTRLNEQSRKRWAELISDYGSTRDVMAVTARPRGGDDSELILTSIVSGVRTETALIRMQNHGNWSSFWNVNEF
ncbi:MAG: hypothetical protein FJ145_10180 [Deltaproteobacteria bacterium]|nr:hypothetical protein [Deltaproteobacteria bacterium]